MDKVRFHPIGMRGFPCLLQGIGIYTSARSSFLEGKGWDEKNISS